MGNQLILLAKTISSRFRDQKTKAACGILSEVRMQRAQNLLDKVCSSVADLGFCEGGFI